MTTYKGKCYCESVKFEAAGPVLGAQICHCSICRRLQGSSLGMLATFFDKNKFEITSGKEFVKAFHSPLKYSRIYCDQCGTKIGITFEDVTEFDVKSVAIYPTHFDITRTEEGLPEEMKPQRHIFYDNRLYDFFDDLPKFVDMPENFGGSGLQLTNEGKEI